MCATVKLTFFKLFIAAAEIAAAHRAILGDTFPRIVSDELDSTMGLRSSSYYLSMCLFTLPTMLDILDRGVVSLMTSVRIFLSSGKRKRFYLSTTASVISQV